MLTRVASSLYWTGRYIERSENLARYISVQYFSTLDAPVSLQKDIVLRSILYMSNSESKLLQASQQQQQGVSQKQQQQQQNPIALNEQDVLVEVAFNLDNSNSLFSCIKAARENARGIRYLISTELWEAINRYYHYANSYPVDYYKTRGLHEFTVKIAQNCSVIRSYTNSTLLHDDVWAFIKLGSYIERTIQIIRILNSKMLDIELLDTDDKHNPLIAYQWATTLRVLETFDSFKKLHKGAIDQKRVLKFILTNPILYRSVAYNLKQINTHLKHLSFAVSEHSSLQFQANKLESQFKFLEYDEIAENPQVLLNKSLKKLYKLHDLIQKEYLT